MQPLLGGHVAWLALQAPTELAKDLPSNAGATGELVATEFLKQLVDADEPHTAGQTVFRSVNTPLMLKAYNLVSEQGGPVDQVIWYDV